MLTDVCPLLASMTSLRCHVYKHLSLGRKVAAFLAAEQREDVQDIASDAFKLDNWYHNLGKQIYISMAAVEKGPLPSLEKMWAFSDYTAAQALLLLDKPVSYKNAMAVQVRALFKFKLAA